MAGFARGVFRRTETVAGPSVKKWLQAEKTLGATAKTANSGNPALLAPFSLLDCRFKPISPCEAGAMGSMPKRIKGGNHNGHEGSRRG